MASYGGFLGGMNEGVSNISPVLNQMLMHKMKSKWDQEDQKVLDARSEAERKRIVDSALKVKQDPNMEVTESYDKSGPSWSAKPKKEPSIKEALVGIGIGGGTPDEIKLAGQRMNIPRPTTTTMEPGMSMPDGTIGDIPMTTQANDQEYQDTIRKALFPDYTREKAVADLAGLPEEKAKKAVVPDEFKTDFADAVNSAGNDETSFTENLRKLAVKYPDNPEVLKLVNEHLAINQKGKSKKAETPSFDDLMK